MKPKRRLLLIASAISLVLAGLALLFSPRHLQLYNVTVLPMSAWDVAINDRGQVVGVAGSTRKPHLLLWDRHNGMKDLGPIYLANPDINNAGQIAGTTKDANGNEQAFFWDPKEGRRLLGTLGGSRSAALALNNHGQVVGYSNSSDGQRQPFIWDKASGMRSLAAHGRQSGEARAINDAGQAIGSIATGLGDATPSWSACYWDSTDPLTTPIVAGLSRDDYPPSRFDINNNGYVLARKRRRPRRRGWFCLWRKDAELKWLGSFDYVDLIAFNDANQVLHSAHHDRLLERLSRTWFPSYTAWWLWDPKGGRIKLDSQIPSSVGKLYGVIDINNHGCIVGMIRAPDRRRELNVLLEPIPERWGK
ncbi:MAG: hypothetical protein JSU94_05700 [Phycisphaerales bacterium]|nr:MAG: hypothetical protein JSU94_05700 [Phycisphaerales bacterium]